MVKINCNICNICLRSNFIQLYKLTEELKTFYAELCNFNDNIITEYTFCPVCIYKLKKCNEFKKLCILASEKFETWKLTKRDIRMPKQYLYTEISTSLSLDNKKNRKVYSCEDTRVLRVEFLHLVDHTYASKFEPEETESQKDTESPKYTESLKDSELLKYTESPKYTESLKDTELLKYTESPIDPGFNDTSGINELKDDIYQSNIDEPYICEYLEDLSQIDDKKILKKGKKTVNLINKRKKIIEDVKQKLKMKFKRNGEVKDAKGNIVDPRIVLKNVAKNSLHNLVILRRIGKHHGAFLPNEIERLSKLQERFQDYEEMFQFKYLGDDQKKEDGFMRRRTFPEYLSYSHRCEKCIKGFRSEKYLDTHITVKHNETLPHSCSLCQSRFSTKRHLHSHVAAFHSMEYKCKMCKDFATNTRSLMITHFAKHKGLMTTCKECGKQFTTKSVYYMHMNKHHRPEFVCRLCAVTFRNEKGFHQHTIFRTKNEEFTESPDNVKCEVCNIIFLNIDVYNKHVEITHSEPEAYTDYIDLEKTMNRVKRRKPQYSCQLCDWKGTTNALREQHYYEMHPEVDMKVLNTSNRYQCQICGKKFQDEQALSTHLNRHTKTRPFACPICPKTFYGKYNLNSHIARHLPPKYDCEYCDKKFSSHSGLWNHRIVHIGDRRHKCIICEKGFLRATSLKAHVKTVHLQIREKSNVTDMDVD